MPDNLPDRVRARLGRAEWHDRIGRMSCFGRSWSVRTDDPELADLLAELYGAVRSISYASPTNGTFSVLVPTDEGPGLVVRDMDAIAYEASSPGATLSGLVWCINRLVIEEAEGHLLLHSTAAEEGGDVLLFVGRPNSGKTNLLTGFLERGHRYVTDEVVSISDDCRVLGFPKPLTVDRGAWRALQHLDPRTGEASDRFHRRQWHLAHPSEEIYRGQGRVVGLIFPRYVVGSDTRIEEVNPAGVVGELFSGVIGRKGSHIRSDSVRRLGRIAAESPAYRIEYGNRDDAVAAICTVRHS